MRKASVVNEHFVAIYFDLEKAYDTTWREGSLRNVYTSGMRGYWQKYVEHFFQQREFNVRIQRPYRQYIRKLMGYHRGVFCP